jgi:hypothetical protein
MTNDLREDNNRPRIISLILVVGMLFGFLLGFLLHDYLAEKDPISRDIKSWYPR